MLAGASCGTPALSSAFGNEGGKALRRPARRGERFSFSEPTGTRGISINRSNGDRPNCPKCGAPCKHVPHGSEVGKLILLPYVCANGHLFKVVTHKARVKHAP